MIGACWFDCRSTDNIFAFFSSEEIIYESNVITTKQYEDMEAEVIMMMVQFTKDYDTSYSHDIIIYRKYAKPCSASYSPTMISAKK